MGRVGCCCQGVALFAFAGRTYAGPSLALAIKAAGDWRANRLASPATPLYRPASDVRRPARRLPRVGV